MTDELLNALDECLARLLQGDNLEATLGRYPALAEELRPLLETAYQATQASYVVGGTEPEALPKLQAAQRAYFLAKAADQRNRLPGVVARKRPTWQQWFSWVWHPAYLGIFVVVLLLSGYGLTAAAYQSLPGDPLYGLKRAVENTQLSLADDLTRAKLQRELEARRLAEIQALAQQGRALPVDFVGVVQQKRASFWLISDLTVTLSTQTLVDGAAEPGQRVRVQGDLQADGTIKAVLLQGLDVPLPGATTEPLLTSTQTPTGEQTHTPTPALNSATPAPPTDTQVVAGSATPTRTALPATRPATNTAVPPASLTPTQGPVEPTFTATPATVPSNTPVPPATTQAPTSFPAPTNSPAPPTAVATDTPLPFPPPSETPAPFPTSTQVPASPTP